jgi:hypothetical protein
VAVGKPAVDQIDEGTVQACGRRGLIEGLQLDEQFVDDPGDALLAGATHAVAGRADGVDLLDETDRTAFAAGVGP